MKQLIVNFKSILSVICFVGICGLCRNQWIISE